MAVRKIFNSTGLCIPEKHYMVDLSEEMDQIEATLVEPGMYFTINRARQYGKTTLLYGLEKRLKKKYLVLSLSFEAADDLFESIYTLTSGLTRRIGKQLKVRGADPKLIEKWMSPVSREFPLDDFSEKVTELCSLSSQRIVLMIDEVDKNSDNQIFLSFLGLLRNKYLEREKGWDKTFHSVILAGVYDIKNLKLKLHPDKESKYNSPWNIAADFTISMELPEKGIQKMLQQYCDDTDVKMNTSQMASQIYSFTSGYPYLVSRLCKLMDEQIIKQGYAWDYTGLTEAVKILLKEANSLFDDLKKKITEHSELSDMLRKILFTGTDIPYNPDLSVIEIASMFGYVKEQNGKVAVSNRIFETRLYNYFLSEQIVDSPVYESALQQKNQFIQNNQLNMRLVLEKFMQYYAEVYLDQSEKFVEENGRQIFLLYLKPIINGVGNYYIEAQTRNRDRTDIIVDYLGRQYVIELKIWHGDEYNRRGEKQLQEYLDAYHLDTGYMLSFCFNKNKKSRLQEILLGDKKLVEVIV